MNPLAPVQVTDDSQSDNPFVAQTPTLADGWAANSAAYGDWVAQQRASGVASGMLDPQTGWPTQNALIDAAHQFGGALIGGTAAPGSARVLYHGMPGKMEGATLRPSDYGNFGPGVYLSEQPSVAKSYGSNVIHTNVNGKLFQAWDRSGVPGTLVAEPEAHDAILGNLPAQDAAKVAGLKNWYGKDSAAFYQALSRMASPAKARDAIHAAGYSGIEGLGDGHEVVVFNPSDVNVIRAGAQ